MLLAVLTGLGCGLVPAFAALRTSVNEGLKEGGRTGTSGGAHARLRSVLVVAEIGVALVLLVASGLLLRSFQKLRSVDLGFHTDRLLTAEYTLPRQNYSTQATVDGFNNALLRKLQQLPGVEAVGITSQLPAAGQVSDSSFVAEGYVPRRGDALNLSWSSQVTGSYFRAMGIPLLQGRDFTLADRAGSPLVVIVNRTLAEHYWPGQSPIGRRLKYGLPMTPTPWLTVVGEIGDVKQRTADAATQEQIYQPADQLVESFGTFAPPGMLSGASGSIVLRSLLPPEQMEDALRTTVRSIDPQLPLIHVEPMERVVEEGQASRRFNAILISCFAGAAVLLALLGIYSVIAFSAALRTKEMAIRLALGSQRASLMQLILISAGKLSLNGLRHRNGISSLCHPPAAFIPVPGQSARPSGHRAGGNVHLPAFAFGFNHSRAPCSFYRPYAGAACGIARHFSSERGFHKPIQTLRKRLAGPGLHKLPSSSESV